MHTSKRNTTVHEIAQLWRTLVLNQNQDYGDEVSIDVQNGLLTISIAAWRDEIHRERMLQVPARRLRWWHTQKRIFQKLNRRTNRVCRKVNADHLSLPNPKHPVRLIPPDPNEVDQ